MRTHDALTRFAAVAAVLTLALAAEPCRAEDDPRASAKKELARFQGAWTLSAMESEGHALGPGDVAGRTCRYEGDYLTLRSNNEVRRRGVVTIDPTRTPKAINTWDVDGPFEDKTVQGIYEFSPDGDTLKLCFTSPDGERPAKFTTKEGTGRLFLVYTRKKP